MSFSLTNEHHTAPLYSGNSSANVYIIKARIKTCQWHALAISARRCSALGLGKAYAHLKVEPTDPQNDGDTLRKDVMGLLVQMSKTNDQDEYLISEPSSVSTSAPSRHASWSTWRRATSVVASSGAGRGASSRRAWPRSSRACTMHIEASFRVIKCKYLRRIANRRLHMHALIKFAADQATHMLTIAAVPPTTRPRCSSQKNTASTLASTSTIRK